MYVDVYVCICIYTWNGNAICNVIFFSLVRQCSQHIAVKLGGQNWGPPGVSHPPTATDGHWRCDRNPGGWRCISPTLGFWLSIVPLSPASPSLVFLLPSWHDKMGSSYFHLGPSVIKDSHPHPTFRHRFSCLSFPKIVSMVISLISENRLEGSICAPGHIWVVKPSFPRDFFMAHQAKPQGTVLDRIDFNTEKIYQHLGLPQNFTRNKWRNWKAKHGDFAEYLGTPGELSIFWCYHDGIGVKKWCFVASWEGVGKSTVSTRNMEKTWKTG